MLYDHLDIHTNRIRHWVTRLASSFIHGGFYKIDECCDVAFGWTTLDCRGHRTTAFMAQDHDQRDMQMLGAVFKASDFRVCCHIAGEKSTKRANIAITALPNLIAFTSINRRPILRAKQLVAQNRIFLCGSLRISAASALKSRLNAEVAEIRREPRRKTQCCWMSFDFLGISPADL